MFFIKNLIATRSSVSKLSFTVENIFGRNGNFKQGNILSSPNLYCVNCVAGKKTMADILGIPEAPKRPLNPYLKYLLTQYKNEMYKDLNVTETMKKIGEEWKKIDESIKSNLKEKYDEEVIEYKKKRLAYQELLTDEQKAAITKFLHERKVKKMKREFKKEAELLGKPKRGAFQARHLLFSEMREELNNKDIFGSVDRKWKNLSPTEQEILREKAKINLNKYLDDVEKFEEKMIEIGRYDMVRKKTLRERGLEPMKEEPMKKTMKEEPMKKSMKEEPMKKFMKEEPMKKSMKEPMKKSTKEQ